MTPTSFLDGQNPAYTLDSRNFKVALRPFLEYRVAEIKDIPLILAPMAGITDRAFRLICSSHGANGCVTEMVSAKAVHFSDKKTGVLARIGAGEAPCALQIFGSDPQIMAQSAATLLSRARADKSAAVPVGIDINMGCPVKKVVSNGEGSALMRSPQLVGQIVKAVSNSVDIPVSVKIRAGWDAEHKNAVEIAYTAQENGASLITVHGRTRSQMYMPGADYSVIADVKKALDVPVIGNGDVFSAEDALRLLETGCDGVMVARGALGNPFIFTEIRSALRGERYEKPDSSLVIETAVKHLDLMISEKGDMAVFEFRKHASWYTKGMRGASSVRSKINYAQTREEMAELLYSLL